MNRREWVDLSAAGESQRADADVCIVGAGAAGLYLGRLLADRGVSVVLVEAGPIQAVAAEEVGFVPGFLADPYPGGTIGRYFGMGGTTSRWGGALVPHTQYDLRVGQVAPDSWRRIVSVVSAHATSVLDVLGYRKDPEFEVFARRCLGPVSASLEQAGLGVQSGLLLPFRRKNLLCLLDTAGKGGYASPRVFYRAVAKVWRTRVSRGADACVDEMLAVSRNGHELRVTARQFILAAGAIESARILLEMNESAHQRLLRGGADPGAGLSDHLSVPIADVAPESNAAAIRWFAPRFQGAWLRGFRMLEKAPGGNTPRYFAHFVFSKESAGFWVAKELLGAVQARRLPRIEVGDFLHGMGDLIHLAANQYLRSRLYVPADQPGRLQLDMEQAANPENRVYLGSQLDEYGRRIAQIDWRITESDIAAIAVRATSLLARWPGPKAGLPALIPRVIGSDTAKPYDAYHPVGTCRMGEDAEAVVDHELKVWGVENLWVVSTGVLPSAGTANPTFTMLCLAQDLIGRLTAGARS
jgi:choline dehydrogenase-like flavoprotein